MDWEPETLHKALEEKYGTVGPRTWDRIEALRLLLSNDSPAKDWHVFEKVGNALNDHIPLFGTLQPLLPEEIAITLTIMQEIADYDFSDEVKAYIATAALNDEFWYVQGTPLEIALPFIEEHFRTHEIELPSKEVADLVSKNPGYVDLPENLTEIQYNSWLDVTNSVKGYIAESAGQLG